MHWCSSADVAGFRFINHSLANPAFDWLMPLASDNPLFGPLLLLLATLLLWRGGLRGRLGFVMLLLVVGCLNNLICDELKHLFARPRPFLDLADARVLVGRGGSFSLPSSHAANWFAAAAVAFCYWRRSLWVLGPLALLVSFSRVYNGVHYPSDVLVGALEGWVTGWGGVWLIDRLWRTLAPGWFPLWWRKLPSLRHAEFHSDPLAWQPNLEPVRDPQAVEQQQWLRLGFVVIVLSAGLRLALLAGGSLELTEDEAYQWLWSKHPALSYFSKPPLIAYLQFIGTHLWGDNAFGVRFCSPILAAILGGAVLRFMARECSSQAGFWLVIMLTAAPLPAVGCILFTIDSPSALFWALTMIASWRALQKQGRTVHWLWVGLWLGLGFLSKYTALLQWLSLALWFWWWPESRRHLRRPGPYLALLVNLLFAIPVLIWNAGHQWITIAHLEDRAGLTEAWHFSLNHLFEFTFGEMGLLNPVFFGATLWAAIAVWRRRRHDPFLRFLLCMGAPLFLIYWIYTLRARVQPNWIAPSVVPLFCLVAAYGYTRWRAGVGAVKTWLVAGLILGLPAVLVLHQPRLIQKLSGHALPPGLDPLRRVHGWTEAAQIVREARQTLAKEGKAVFIIGDHYGTASLIAFYLPEAKAGVPDNPVVYVQSSPHPLNQFYFWPGYNDRKGDNALYVRQCKEAQPPPPGLAGQFASITDLGMRDVVYRGQVIRRLQLLVCRDLR